MFAQRNPLYFIARRRGGSAGLVASRCFTAVAPGAFFVNAPSRGPPSTVAVAPSLCTNEPVVPASPRLSKLAPAPVLPEDSQVCPANVYPVLSSLVGNATSSAGDLLIGPFGCETLGQSPREALSGVCRSLEFIARVAKSHLIGGDSPRTVSSSPLASALASSARCGCSGGRRSSPSTGEAHQCEQRILRGAGTVETRCPSLGSCDLCPVFWQPAMLMPSSSLTTLLNKSLGLP